MHRFRVGRQPPVEEGGRGRARALLLLRVRAGVHRHPRPGVAGQGPVGQFVGLLGTALLDAYIGQPARPGPALRPGGGVLLLDQGVAALPVRGVAAGVEGVQHQAGSLVPGPLGEMRHQVVGGQPVLPVRIQEDGVHQTCLSRARGTRVPVCDYQLVLQHGVAEAAALRQHHQRPGHTAARLLAHPLSQQVQSPPAQGQQFPYGGAIQ
ncbi:hypothetical protein [Streptomyces aculeolatus]|uniref:hypothetical protein n=1 Tax=Streptomyces aculeolatus TaxID=270689 RepID=UPI001CEDF12B|nr:hypothetical protein [Streptomyces aculeolatus]